MTGDKPIEGITKTGLRFRFETTGDGSPTVVTWREADRESQRQEAMHNRVGAFAETEHVYGGALRIWQNLKAPPRFFSLGLGLGYNELLVASALTPTETDSPDFLLTSYESEEFLRDQFLSWLQETEGVGRASSPPSDPWFSAYEEILRRFSAQFDLESEVIKGRLRTWWDVGRWQVGTAFSADSALTDTYHCLFYDAFSRRKNPQLWDETTLMQVLTRVAGGPAVFATYAATGDLNRALRLAGFSRIPYKGFGGKRESTLAVRERRRE